MRCAIGLVAAIVGVSACASNTPGDGDDVSLVDGSVTPDARPDSPDSRPPIDATPPVDAMIDAPTEPIAVVLSHSASTAVLAEKSAACRLSPSTPVTAENSFYRVFRLPEHGVNGQFTATSFEFGIQVADGLSGAQIVEIRLHTLSGVFQTGNLTLVYSDSVLLANQQLTTVQVDVSPPVVFAPGATVVAEVFTKDSSDDGDIFVIGANDLGETDDSYVRAPTCEIYQPQTFASVAFPDTHIVLTVSGTTP